LTEKAIKVFTELFYRFSPSGKMTKAELAKFVESSTNDSCTVHDYRVNDVFSRFDEDKDEILSV
jgi:Ca2+-binding EF-hand superfamily protein